MYNPDKAPRISPELVKWLKENFPKKSYDPNTAHQRIMYEEGIQEMLNILERISEDQSNK